MRLKSFGIDRSPSRPGYVRLSGDISYNTAGLSDEVYWYEVPEKYASFLSETGNPWLVVLAPLAAVINEPIILPVPVDPQLLNGVYERMRVWKCWYAHLNNVRIEADLLKAPVENLGMTGSFFSGGVDAYFSVLYHDHTDDPGARVPVDDLINVWGFDIPYDRTEEHSRFMATFRGPAQKLGKELVEVATNIRQTQLEKHAHWEWLNLGCALASVGHALEKRYKKVLISSGGGHRAMGPHGSTPYTDALNSTPTLQVMQAGAAFNRAEKTSWIAGYEAVQESLHVCFFLKSDKNCGRCLKCYRTMLTLETVGLLDRFSTFPKGAFDFEQAARTYLWDVDDVRMAAEIRQLARLKDRKDVVRAIERSLSHSRRIRTLLRLILPLRKYALTRKIFWWWEAKILQGFVGGQERYYPESRNDVLAMDETMQVVSNWK